MSRSIHAAPRRLARSASGVSVCTAVLGKPVNWEETTWQAMSRSPAAARRALASVFVLLY